jgi:hypothetical protein
MRIAKRNLKKQSQFAEGQMNVTSFHTRYYGNNSALGLPEDKPRQSQFQTGRLLINRMSLISYSVCMRLSVRRVWSQSLQPSGKKGWRLL